MNAKLSRRRVIAITGSFAATAALASTFSKPKDLQLVRWEGEVLGAIASLELYHPDPPAAQDLLAECVAEVDRLERIFSLYHPASTLSRLNREGGLSAPPPEFVYLLNESLRFAALSGGAFDVTVQPLWTLYADHFARNPDDTRGPTAEAIDAARALVDYRKVTVGTDEVKFQQPGMAITFNSVGQGYITDRVSTLLRRRGIERILADLGEFRSFGDHPDGRPWHVGIGNPQAPDRVLQVVELRDRAMASSGGYGWRFDRAGHFHHLFDPASGRSSSSWAGTTVVARSATTANALSTALAVAPRDQASAILRAGGGERAYLVDADNRVTVIEG